MTEAFYAITKASFQGSIVILAVLVLRLLLQKAPRGLFCLLWLLAGLRLALPFDIQSPFSLQPRLEETSITVQVEKPVQNPADDYFDSQPQQNIPQLSPELPEIDWEDIPAVTYPLQHVTIPEPVSYGEIAAGIWAVGLTAMLTASAVSYFRLKRRVREACLVEKGCFECAGLETAFVLGFMPPKIYLPVGLTDREKAFIYDHENTHIARHDHWFKLLGYLVLSIHWFNPLVWLGYHLLCRDMELACDEHVVRDMTLPERKAYSAALLSCGSHTARIAACPVAFGESNPKRRIMNVLNYKRPTFWISLLAVAAVIFVSVCLLTSPENKEEAPPEEELRWNLEMQVTDVTPSGATVEFIQQGDFPDRGAATLQFGTHYTLERLENGQWAEVEMLPQEYDVAWTMEAYMIEIGKTATRRENWEWLYGELPAGHYRIGKDVDLFRTTGDWDSEMFYAEFDIAQTEPEQPAWTMDMTEEEYLAMCRDAVAEIQSREQFHISETLVYYKNDNEDSRSNVTFWRDGKNWLRESYVTRMRENRNMLYYDGMMYMQWQKEGEEAAWNLVDSSDGDLKGMTWLHWLRWDSQSVTFEAAEEKEEELLISVIVEGTPPTLGWDDVQEYNVQFVFDKVGNMNRATMTAYRGNIKVIDELTIETTMFSIIHNKLENVAAQRPDAPQMNLTDEQWLEKCRVALEEYQSQGVWVILEENQFSGSAILNDSSFSLWHIDGQDWTRQMIINTSDFYQENWYMKKDGMLYEREIFTDYDSASDGFDTGWAEMTNTTLEVDNMLPWPLLIDWDSLEIISAKVHSEGDSKRITLEVDGNRWTDLQGQAEEYTVTLWLWPNGDLQKIQLDSVFNLSGIQLGVNTVITLYAGAPVDAKNMISQCYDEALLHVHGICNDPDCTDTTHDHYGIACTVEHCTNPAHGHGDGHHSDEHHDES